MSQFPLFSVRMLSHGQKRVWRYVEEGSLLKLKSYLRKHRDLDVNFSQGKRQRSPLHLACELGDDATLRLLLKHGADVLQKDRKGNTALHTAANRALKYGKTGIKLEANKLLLTYVICCTMAFIFVFTCFSVRWPGCAPEKELPAGPECSEQRWSHTWRPSKLDKT